MRTRRSASWNGSGLSSAASMTEKMAVFAPMPSASVNTATAANPGCLARVRTAYRTSFKRVLIVLTPFSRGRRTLDDRRWPELLSSIVRRPPSFVSESHHRVDLRRAARGDEAGDERDEREQQREAGEGQRVGRRDAEELAL